MQGRSWVGIVIRTVEKFSQNSYQLPVGAEPSGTGGRGVGATVCSSSAALKYGHAGSPGTTVALII